jgi:hypothetical protein
MQIEQQVCSLELAKKLKELGVKQESYFIWVMSIDSPQDGYKDGEYKLTTFQSPFVNTVTNYYAAGRDNPKYPMFSAFTVVELGEMLPQIIKIKETKYQLFISVALDKQFFVVYVNEEDYEDNAPFPIIMRHNEADARAEMLIYLIENNLIKP